MTSSVAAAVPQALAQALGGSVGPNPDGKFVLTIEQVTPTQQLSQFKQLDAILQQALQSTTSVASPPVDAPAADRQATAAQAVAAVAAVAEHEQDRGGDCCDGAAVGVSNSSSSLDAVVVPVSEQLSACSLEALEGGSSVAFKAASSTGACAGSVGGDKGGSPCTSRCFRLIESHGDQVGYPCLAVTINTLLCSWGHAASMFQAWLLTDLPPVQFRVVVGAPVLMMMASAACVK